MGDARTTREEAGFPSLPCSWAPVLLPHVERRASASSAIQRRPPNARQPRKTPQERDQTANRECASSTPSPSVPRRPVHSTRYLSSYRPTWRAAPRRGYHRSWATQGPARLPGSPSRQSSVYSPALVACSGEHAIRLIVCRRGSDARAASSNICLLCTEYWQRGLAAGCWHRRGRMDDGVGVPWWTGGRDDVRRRLHPANYRLQLGALVGVSSRSPRSNWTPT